MTPWSLRFSTRWTHPRRALLALVLAACLLSPGAAPAAAFVPAAPIPEGYSNCSPSPNTTGPGTATAEQCAPAPFIENVLLPDLAPLPPSDLYISTGSVPGRRVLRLTSAFTNLGSGKLELAGAPTLEGDKAAITQNIYASGEIVAELPAGEFIFHPTHNHWHMENFVSYELWSLDWQGHLEDVAGLTDKVSFCLRDTWRARDAALVAPARYLYCGRGLQGISPGWVDVYTYDLPGQYIDITGLPDGVYAIRLVVDPENYILERRDDNNIVRLNLEIRGRQVRVLEDEGEYRRLLERSRPGRLQSGLVE